MIFRSSQIKTAKSCIAKSYYKYILGLSRKGGKENIDLFFGKAVHEGVEISLNSKLQDGLDYLDSLNFPPSSRKNAKIAQMLVRSFHRIFDLKFVEAERYFTIDVADDLTLLGKYDIIGKNLDGNKSIGEIKTTAPYYLLNKPNDQFISYFIAGKTEFENFDTFNVYLLDPATISSTKRQVFFNDEEIENWIVEIKSFLYYVNECYDSKVLPRNEMSCLMFNRRCPYLEICSAPTKRMLRSCLDTDFDINEEAKNLLW